MRPDRLTELLIAGDWTAAEALLAPLAARPDAPVAVVYNHGKVLIELGCSREAVAALRRVCAQAPGRADAWFELGRAALLHEDFDTALEAFAEALARDPDDRDARRNLGRVALRLGQWEAARAAWEGLGEDDEAGLALYRIAAETGAPDAPARRARLLAAHPDRAAVILTLVRTSKGAIPLDLRHP
jgi:cytochrome c-type biogenesis protein CcmH/NrfG